MLPKDEGRSEKASCLFRIATVEGWLALVLAIGSWLYAMRPIGPMIGMPVEGFIRDFSFLLPAAIGFGLGVSGIRHGNDSARVAGRWAVGLLVPLLLLGGYNAVRRSFLL